MSIFDYKSIKNKPSRSTFDMSQNVAFTAKLGQLTPINHRILCPGDEVDINISSFTQTSPLNTNAFARIRENVDFFFVPFHLLYSKANDVIMSNNVAQVASTSFSSDNVVPTNLPYTDCHWLYDCLITEDSRLSGFDCSGLRRYDGAVRLLEYLGYPILNCLDNSLPNFNVSLMPLAAYQKIYQDFFRFNQWEDNNPYTYNFDYLDVSDMSNALLPYRIVHPGYNSSSSTAEYGKSLLDIRYVNYHKDFVYGGLPSQVSDVYVGSSDAVFDVPHFQGNYANMRIPLEGELLSTLANGSQVDINNVKLKNFRSNITVLQLRASFALQKWAEVQQFSDNNYKALVKAHFGVDVPDWTAHMAQFLGGSENIIRINDVVNQNLTSGNADRKAFANGLTNGKLHFSCKEHGILMALYYATPVLNYDSTMVMDPMTDVISSTDFPRPEFDSLGLEPLFSRYVNSTNEIHDIFSYVPRYFKFKSVMDYHRGDFARSLKNFIVSPFSIWSPRNPGDYRVFKVNPKDVNNIFVAQAGSASTANVYEDDAFYVNCGVDMKKTTDLSYNGMPY